MATSPRSASPGTPAAVDESEFSITNKQFGEHLALITKGVEDLVQLALAVGGLKKGERLLLESGAQIGKRELRTAASTVVAKIRELKKYHKEAGRPKKRQVLGPDGQPKRRGGGFSLPIRITPELQQFFATANLGLVDPRDPGSGQLLSKLALLTQYGITSRSLLTPLFSIYAQVNGLQNPGQRSRLHADAHMRQYLGSALAKLEATIPEHMGKPGKSGKPPKRQPAFDSNSFPYSYLQYIIKENKVSLSPEEKAALQKDENTLALLAAEQKLVSDTLAVYRAANKAQTAKRRSGKTTTVRA